MMRFKGFFADSSAFVHLAVLMALVVTGLILATMLSSIIYFIPLAQTDSVRIMQLLSSSLLFLFPALAFAWLCSYDVAECLSLRMLTNVKVWAAVFAAMILIIPFINATAYLNSLLKLPAFMSFVEEWMQEMETSVKDLTESLIDEKGAKAFIANMTVIAVAAGVTEEFFFRGALQRVMERWISDRHHTVIWVTALIFGLVHLQFYGLLPRVILGACFGYLLYWTKSLWIPVFAHFVNNAFALAGSSSESLKDTSIVSGEIPAEYLVAYLIITPLAMVLFYLCMRYVCRASKTED